MRTYSVRKSIATSVIGEKCKEDCYWKQEETGDLTQEKSRL